MDYSKFLDENFDVKEWVNAAFRQQKEGTNDQYATTLVMKLQMFIQEVNNVIEESCQQAISNLPRVMRELEAVRQEAQLLQEQMKMVKHDIQKVEHDTALSMQTLLKLDAIKSRMMDASEALQEADNWTTLSANVDEVFDSGDVNKISEKLVGMQQSLSILTDVPDYAERCHFLETLKNKLEAMLSPQVVAAFSSQSLESAQKFVKIFESIDRLPQLEKYYHRYHKGQLLQKWRQLQSDNQNASLKEWLSEFYDILLSMWHTQIQWCGQVFEKPAPVVCELLTDTLLALDPSLPVCIERHLQGIDYPLDILIDLKQMSERFAKSIEKAIESRGKGDEPCPNVQHLAVAIYLPYRPYVKNYTQLEEAILSAALLNIPLDHEEVMETVRLLTESVAKLFSAANQANERCVQFTNGCGYISFPQTLNNYFSDYLKEFHRVLVNIREKCHLESTSVDSDDWSMFQNSLRIIQTCGDLLCHIEEFDMTVVSSVIGTVGKYCPPVSPIHQQHSRTEPKSNPFTDYKNLLLESKDDKKALEILITSLEEGDNPSILDLVHEEFCHLSAEIHRFAFDIVFKPLEGQLSQIPTMEVWTSESAGGAITADLPVFSLSPQEYITKIGQYLMTLPQQLDPFTLDDNPTLAIALKHSKLPYTAEQTDIPENMADLWLESVAMGTMHNYAEQILKIPELSQLASKQLATDIDYLTNVVEDLGLHPSDALTNILKLLQATPETYTDVSENMPQRLTSALASMRKLSLD